MTTIRVTDVLDKRLKVFSNLTNHQLRNRLDPKRGLLIAESEIAIRVALEEGVQPISFLLDERKHQAMRDVLEGIPDEVPVYVLPPKEAERLTGFSVTRGALCAMRRPCLPTVETILDDARHVVVLEGMTDASNVGSAMRNAAALGADAVLVAPNCADPLCRRAVRVSMGNVFRIPWCIVPRPWPADAMRLLGERGFVRVALALEEDAKVLSKAGLGLDESSLVAVFLGTEGTGLTPEVIEACDVSAIIPMAHGVDSLNVASAGAIAMWELF